MKIFVVALLLLVGCTGVVQTRPSSRPPPPREPPPPRGDRPPPPPPPREPDERWVELGEPQYNEDFRDTIKPGPGAGTFRKLRVDIVKGRVLITQVGIEYDDGISKTQAVKLGEEKGAGDSLRIDLDGGARKIKRIVIYVDPAQGRRDRGVYRLFGR